MKYSLTAKNLVRRNLEAKTSYYAELVNPGHTKEITGLLRIDSGLHADAFNPVISNSVLPVHIFKRFVVDYFAERHSGFTLLHCASVPFNDQELAEIGVMPIENGIAMAAELSDLGTVDDDRTLSSALTIEPLGPGDFGNYAAIISNELEDSRERRHLKSLYEKLEELPEFKRQRLKMYIAKWNGEPAGTGALFSSADAIGFYDIVTLPDYRGRGIGTAMFNQLVEDAKCSHHKHAVLQTVADKQDFFASAGFHSVGEIAVYEYHPHAA